jgi:hypothetical protein
MPRVGGVLHELTGLEASFEVFLAEEVVIHPVPLSRPGRSGGR